MRTAIVSTYPPRACGIGTFSADLRATLPGTGTVTVADLVAVVHEPSSPQRRGLLATIAQAVRGDYVRTARMLGRLDVDVVLLQHEYGIFGGPDGEYVLSFARELAQPLVVTLHTVLSEPSPHQREVLTELCAEAELVIVMTDTALRLLVGSGACPEEKVRVVAHGAPARIAERAALSAANGRFRLSTFGLISPGKGLETVIEALPAMIERHPEIVYTIAGRTHPDVSRREGERYRLMLERRVLELGLDDNVEFDDRFLSIDELSDLLAATDVFVTPYGNREQIASGALTFAIAAGCAVISTPYWYAQDMLASGAGLLVPFRDSEALADAVCSYVERPDMLLAARAEAQRIGSTLAWPAVAKATARVLEEAAELAPQRRPAGVADLHLSSLRTDHLLTLADDVGIVQHAQGIIPNRSSGYCVDDVARLAVVSLALAERGDERVWTSNLYRALAFLQAAADDGGAMRNFMSYDRRWLDEPHAGDHVGRSIWALGDILATAWIPAVVRPAQDLLDRLVGMLGADVSLRTAAYAVLGLSRLDADRLEPAAHGQLERLVEQLAEAYERTRTEDWCWFEDELSYDNARLSQALLIGANALDRPELAERALESLRWLGDECGLDKDALRLPEHHGRRRGEPAPGAGDEQPLDAAALVEAELSAFAVTHNAEHGVRAIRAFEWFLGRNRLQKPLYDFATGGCSDGLGREELYDNEGAE